MACGLLVVACVRDLVPRPGIEPRSPALGAQSLIHWTTRQVLPSLFSANDNEVMEIRLYGKPDHISSPSTISPSS